MPRLTGGRTFGFEAEFAEGARELNRHLHEQGYTPQPDLHRWHCDCSDCEFGPEDRWLFRGQRDSTCDGEIISSVMDNLSDLRVAAATLQEAAIAVDAVPGDNAGCHVHVLQPQSETDRHRCLWQFARWEPTLIEVGSAAFRYGREGQNQTTRQYIHSWMRSGLSEPLLDFLHARTGETATSQVPEFLRMVESGDFTATDPATLQLQFFRYVHEADRHTSVSTRTRHNTWEFRLWNSTRSSWRIELFVRLSMLISTPSMADRMDAVPVDEVSPERLLELVHEEDSNVAELLERQVSYLRNMNVPTPRRFTENVLTTRR